MRTVQGWQAVFLVSALLVLGPCPGVAKDVINIKVDAKGNVPFSTDDAAQQDLIAKGIELISHQQQADAIRDAFDPVIAHYESLNSDPQHRRYYCARTVAETLTYSVLDKATKTGTVTEEPTPEIIVLAAPGADAYKLKAYALIDLHRLAEARVAMDRAVALSPEYPGYMIEDGYLYTQEKNFAKALERYQSAAGLVDVYTPEALRRIEKARALRGEGSALTDLGRLAEAKAAYQESLAIEPYNLTAHHELDYIATLEARTQDGKPQP